MLSSVQTAWQKTGEAKRAHLDDFCRLDWTEVGAQVLQAALLHKRVQIAEVPNAANEMFIACRADVESPRTDRYAELVNGWQEEILTESC